MVASNTQVLTFQDSGPNLLITGPAGGGKSHLLRAIRSTQSLRDLIFTCDIRDLSYLRADQCQRKGKRDKREWRVHSSTFDYLAKIGMDAQKRVLAVGSSADVPTLVCNARSAGFAVSFLIPDGEILRLRRSIKGLSSSVVAKADSARAAWMRMAEQLNVNVISDVTPTNQ